MGADKELSIPFLALPLSNVLSLTLAQVGHYSKNAFVLSSTRVDKHHGHQACTSTDQSRYRLEKGSGGPTDKAVNSISLVLSSRFWTIALSPSFLQALLIEFEDL